MSVHDEMLDSVAVYALGVLSPNESAQVAEHMRTCDECREEYRRLRSSVTALAYSSEACADAAAGATVPSPLLKARLMRRIRQERVEQPSQPVWIYAAAAACLVLALGSGLLNFFLNAHLRETRARLAQQSATIADLTASHAKRYSFRDGEVITNGRQIYVAFQRLAALPAGRVYQAWTLARGATKVAPSVTFRPDTSGMALVSLPVDATSLDAVAVSVEPAGGSTQPTTTPIVSVKLKRQT